MNNIYTFQKRNSPNRFRKPNRNYNAHGVELMRSACTEDSLLPALRRYFNWYICKHLTDRVK